MAAPVRFTIGDIKLSRVEYFDVALDPDAVSLTPEQVASVPSAVPAWANEAGQVLVGQAMWVLESAGTTIVVDGVPDGHEVAPGVVVQVTGAHTPGHAVIRVGHGDGQGVMVGHLAVSPLHAMTGPCAGLKRRPSGSLVPNQRLRRRGLGTRRDPHLPTVGVARRRPRGDGRRSADDHSGWVCCSM